MPDAGSLFAPPQPRQRFAVLVDADNVPPDLVRRALQSIRRHGEPVVRRAYGALADTAKAAELQAMGLTPVHCARVCQTRGRNAADIALTIDAIDLLHRGGLDAIVIGSSDSDFTPLARRIREAGVAVFGFGDHDKCTDAYRAAFTRFFAKSLAPSAPTASPATASPVR
jgi:hypothetical protein